MSWEGIYNLEYLTISTRVFFATLILSPCVTASTLFLCPRPLLQSTRSCSFLLIWEQRLPPELICCQKKVDNCVKLKKILLENIRTGLIPNWLGKLNRVEGWLNSWRHNLCLLVFDTIVMWKWKKSENMGKGKKRSILRLKCLPTLTLLWDNIRAPCSPW